MGSSKRRNRSTERAKKGISSGAEASVSKYGNICQQSEFWHWKHLECWQSWSHLFHSQNSNFGLCALLMMMKNPSVWSSGFWHPWLPAVALWEKAAQSALLSRDGAEGCIPPGELCHGPRKQRACRVSPGLWHDLPFPRRAVAVLCYVGLSYWSQCYTHKFKNKWCPLYLYH